MGDESHDYIPDAPVTDAMANTQIKSQSRGDLFDLFNLNKNEISKQGTDGTNVASHNKLNRSISGSLESDTDLPADVWRDNWVMSRSIPSSLNKCNNNGVSNFSANRNQINSQLSGGEISTSTELINAISRNTKSMYLPEYNPKYISDEKSMGHSGLRLKDGSNRKEAPGIEAENSVAEDTSEKFSELYKKQNFINRLNGESKFRNGKKFSYKSTVRVLEMKKIEEKLNREIEENEKKRLREAAAMKQVEEEFQIKREKEKRMQQRQGDVARSQSSVNKSTQSEHTQRPRPRPAHQHSFAVQGARDLNGNLHAKAGGRDRGERESSAERIAAPHPFAAPAPAQGAPMRLTISVNQ